MNVHLSITIIFFSYVTIDTEKAPRLCLVPLYLNYRVQKLYALQWFTYFLLTVSK